MGFFALLPLTFAYVQVNKHHKRLKSCATSRYE